MFKFTFCKNLFVQTNKVFKNREKTDISLNILGNATLIVLSTNQERYLYILIKFCIRDLDK